MAGAMFSIKLARRMCRRRINLNASAGRPRKIGPGALPKEDHALALAKPAPFNDNMFGVATSDDYQPVAYMGRYPIHVTMLLVMVHVACLILSCFLLAFGGGSILSLLAFDSRQVISSGHFWQIATYAFVPSPSSIIWFAIEMYMLFAFGREVERFIGRRAFIALYLLLLLAPTMLLSIGGLWQRTGLAGSATIHFAIFVAFRSEERRV